MPRYEVTFTEERHYTGEVVAKNPRHAVQVARRNGYDRDLTEVDFASVEVVDVVTGQDWLAELD